MLMPVRRSTFREHIVDTLRAAILDGGLAPGSPIVEARLAREFGVSRQPLREAIRSLIGEGLLVAVPYTGTRVVDLSLRDIHEIFTIRTELEAFAFRLVWARRGAAFAREMEARHAGLLACVDAGDDSSAIRAELRLHSWVYEAAGHTLLLDVWRGLQGRLQLYWAAHHLAHGRRGPKRDGHVSYVDLALGDSLELMLDEIRRHMVQGFSQTEAFLLERLSREAPGAPVSGGAKRSGQILNFDDRPKGEHA